jgi:integrase
MRIKMAQRKRALFGTTRALPSGRVQATYQDKNQKRHSLGTFANEKAARSALAAVETDLARGQWEDPSKNSVTFADFVTQISEIDRARLAPATWEGYECIQRKWLLPYFGRMTLRDIDSLAIDTWHASLGKKTGAVNVRNIYFRLSGIMKKAVKYGHIRVNPCAVEDGGKAVAKPRPFLELEDFNRIVAAAPENLHAALIVTLGAQLRLGEVCGLNRGDYDDKTGVLTVERQAQRVRGEGVQLRETKTGSKKAVKLPTQAQEAARTHLQSVTGFPLDPMFRGPKGGRLTSSYLHNQWVKAASSVGLPNVHLHDARHTGATLYVRAGGTIKQVMYRLGHSTSAAAMHYQHATASEDALVADRLSEIMNGTR